MIFDFLDKMKKGSVYAVQVGDYVGQFFNYVKKDDSNYFFLSTPNVEIVKVPKEKFDFALNNGIIEYVETLPRNIFKVIKAQYQQLSETNGKNTF
jgi:hypothetical protein